MVAGFSWGIRPQPAIRFGCRWWMRVAGWSQFRLFTGSTVSRATPSGRWSADERCRVGWLTDELLDFDDGDRYRLPAVLRVRSGRPVARGGIDRACHADIVQPVGVAVVPTPGDCGRCCTGQLGVAKRGCDRVGPARLSSLRGMALQCSRTHDQDV